MNYIDYSSIVLAGMLLPACGEVQQTKTYQPVKPNIILLLADDLGWGDVGFNGNKIIKTPNLDEMCQNGLRFERFYSAAPVSSPTRGSCITGRHPYRYGIWFANEGHMRKEEITIAEVLKEQGYTTGHFGKWHLGTLDTIRSGKGKSRNPARNYSTPGMNGFDEWFSTEFAVQTWNPGMSGKNKNLSNPYVHNGKVVSDNIEGCDSRVLMDRAIPFIRQAVTGNTPFLAVIWFHAAHAPVIAGPEFRKMYQEYDSGQQDFYGVVTAMDVQIGRLRKELRDLGIDGNTMLWFASDNGPEGDTEDEGTNRGTTGSLRGRKRSLWEGGIRVPALIEWPGHIKAGNTTAIPCSTLDYFPTLVDIFGFKLNGTPRPIDGISLSRLFTGEMKERPVPIPFETIGGYGTKTSRGSSRMAIVDNRYKLLTDMDQSGDFLYDLQTDRSETKNIASEHSDIVKSMKKVLVEFRESCRNSGLGKDYDTPFVSDKDDINPNLNPNP